MAKYLTIALFFAPIFVFGKAEILFGPQNTEAIVEETVELRCKGTLGDVEWQHLAVGASNTELVYKDGFFYNGYKHRYTSTRTHDGGNSLIIRRVKPKDAGTFICLENSETPSRRTAELIVIERFPSNEACSGKYTCKPVCNELELSCEMKVHSNYIPSMEWTDSRGRVLTSLQIVVNGTVISTVKLSADPYEMMSYTCQMKYLNSPLTFKHSWTYSTSGPRQQLVTDSLQDAATQPSLMIAIVVTAVIVFVACVTIFFVINLIWTKWMRSTKPETNFLIKDSVLSQLSIKGGISRVPQTI